MEMYYIKIRYMEILGAQARKERLSFELLQVVSLLTGEADRRMLTVE